MGGQLTNLTGNLSSQFQNWVGFCKWRQHGIQSCKSCFNLYYIDNNRTWKKYISNLRNARLANPLDC